VLIISILRIITTFSPPSTGNYSFNISYVYGSSQCRHITEDLNFCKGYLSPLNKYNLADQEDVAWIEDFAMNDYATLAESWPVSTCNSSLIDFACKANFQPKLCEANGAITKTYLCLQDCINTLSSACLQNGESANLCEKEDCTNVVYDISPCNTPPASGAFTLPIGIIFSLLTIFLWSIFNNEK